jgi:hypothetical protein
LLELDRTWQNLAELGRTWQNLAELGRTWQNLAELGSRIRQNLAKPGRTSLGVTGSRYVCTHMFLLTLALSSVKSHSHTSFNCSATQFQ